MINTNDIQHILISRTDNIGDVVLTLPMVGLLKQQFPQATISFLAREYVRDVIESCQHIDAFYSWDVLSSLATNNKTAAINDIQSKKIDVVLHVFAQSSIASLMKAAKIKYRIGTTHRLYHWWTCNQSVNFSRAKSDLHEAQLNLKLLKPLNGKTEETLPVLSALIGLHIEKNKSLPLENIFRADRFNLIIHPFTNGHTREWPVSHFNALIRQLPTDKFQIILTGSAKEQRVIQDRIMSQCPQAVNIAGLCSLHELMQLLNKADGVIANATGPMHLAAALGVRTLGLFPATKGIDPKRWGPIGKNVDVLIANPNCQHPRCRDKEDCFCMESIGVEEVKRKVLGWADQIG